MSREEVRSDEEKGSFLSPRLCALLAVTAIAYFVLRLIYFTIAIHHSSPPDETTHLERVLYFSRFFLLPGGVPGEGESHLWITRYHPSLYYILAGKFSSLNLFYVSDLIFVRLFSIVLSCLTVWYGWRFVKLLSPKPIVHLLFLVMLTNTLMFSFLSAAVNYDCAVNLFAAAACFYMTDYFKGKEPRSFFSLLIALLLGTLTKLTMLPFCFVVAVAVIVHEWGDIRVRITQLVSAPVAGGRAVRGTLLAALLLFLLNGILYGNNVLRYGHLVPRTEQVISGSDANSLYIDARETIYTDFLHDKVSYEESMEKAKALENRLSSLDTINLLNYAAWRKETQGPFVPMSRLAYVVPWSKLMLFSTFGVMGHSVAYKSMAGHVPYLLVFLVAGAFFIRSAFGRRAPVYELLFIGMFVTYALILMQVVNFNAYLSFQLQHIGVQGRYLFPFLLPVYGLTASYLLAMKSPRLQAGLAIAVAVFFIYGDFPFFLSAWGNGPW